MSTPLGDVTSGDAMSSSPNPKPTSPRNLLSKIPCGGFSRKGESGKRFWQRSVSDLKGWGMAAEMCELMQKRVDF